MAKTTAQIKPPATKKKILKKSPPKIAKSKKFSFSELSSKLQDINPDCVILGENNSYVKIENWIGLGNYMLNAQVSGSIFKGIHEGRIAMLAGESQCLHPDQEVYVYIGKTKDNKEIEET